MTLPIDRTNKNALDANLVNGITSDAPKLKANNQTVYDTIDELYNYAAGLVASDKLSNLGIINATDFGVVVGDSSKDYSTELQIAIDTAITTGKTLRLCPGTIHITNGIVIWNSVRIEGVKDQVNGYNPSQIYYHGDGTAITVRYKSSATGTFDDTNHVASLRLSNFTLNRDNGEVIGTLGIGIDFYDVNESVIHDLSVYGFKVNAHFRGGGIMGINRCHFNNGQYGVWLSSNAVDGTVSGVCAVMTFLENNFYQNASAAIYAGGRAINFIGNQFEASPKFFHFDMDDNNRTIENYVVEGNNFRVDSSTSMLNASAFYLEFSGATYQYVHGLIIRSNKIKMEGTMTAPINYKQNGKNVDVYMTFWNNEISGADQGIVVSDNANTKPYVDFTGINFVRKFDETSYTAGTNVYGNGKAIGFVFDSTVNTANNPINLARVPTATPISEGYFAYDNTKQFLRWNDGKGDRWVPSMKFAANNAPTEVSPSVLDGTIAWNLSCYGGNPLGWVYHHLSGWQVFAQAGYSQNAGSPVSIVNPSFIGQMLLDTTNKNWYISVGTTSTDWKIIT